MSDEVIRPAFPDFPEPEYDPETDESRWTHCGKAHPTFPGVTCRVYVFDKETHEGIHMFLVRWEDEDG